jgi:hypothetical protein
MQSQVRHFLVVSASLKATDCHRDMTHIIFLILPLDSVNLFVYFIEFPFSVSGRRQQTTQY